MVKDERKGHQLAVPSLGFTRVPWDVFYVGGRGKGGGVVGSGMPYQQKTC